MTTPKPQRAKASEPDPPVSPLAHVDGCAGNRIDTFTVTDPTGSRVKVTRCLDCASANYERE